MIYINNNFNISYLLMLFFSLFGQINKKKRIYLIKKI